MSWRIVVISNRCKLDLKMGYMVVRGEETLRVFLDEIAILMIENPAVALTGCLIEALVERKVRVIFCGSHRSPIAELCPHHGSHDTTRKLRMQTVWSDETKGLVWSAVVSEKIRQQALHLEENDRSQEAALLRSYIRQIEPADATNREGHAAKVYFNALFGMQFSRQDDSAINKALNYGYAVLLSAFNREISACGYLTELGIHHDNVFNHFNLSSDLMEPYRILVDRKTVELAPHELDKPAKLALVNILNLQVEIADSRQTVLNSIRIYLRSIFDALNENDTTRIIFYKL